MNLSLERIMDAAFALDRAFTTSPTTNAYGSLVPTLTKPTTGHTAGVFSLDQYNRKGVPRWVLAMGLVDGDGKTCNVRLTGWRRLELGTATLWVPVNLGELLFTGSTMAGVGTGNGFDAAEVVADTVSIVANHGTSGVDVLVFSPQDDTPAHALIWPKGCELIQWEIKVGTAANGNVLWSTL